MSIKKSIPNAITLLNLFSGCIAVYFGCIGNIPLAAVFTLLGIFFDFFDGFFARILNVNSELGLQLDSLADMITSGFVPGIIMFQLLKESSFINNFFPTELPSNDWVDWLPFLGFLITLASCYRLANFNIDTRQTSSFIGLPTPANALFILSLGLLSMDNSSNNILLYLLQNTWFLLSITAFSCYILNANIELFALKFKSWDFSKNKVRYLFILTSLILIILFTYLGILLVILGYLILSLILKIKESI